MSDLKLSMLMINSNCLAVVLEHLWGIIDGLQQVQFCEYTRWLSDRGEFNNGETVATWVAEQTLDEEFSSLNLDTELEDFGEVLNQEGS